MCCSPLSQVSSHKQQLAGILISAKKPRGTTRKGSLMTSTATMARTMTPAKILAVLMGVLVALALLPSAAQAIATKDVPECKFQTKTATIQKKATTVKKGTTKIVVDGGTKRTVWTSDAPIDETQGFYRVKVESNCQQ